MADHARKVANASRYCGLLSFLLLAETFAFAQTSSEAEIAKTKQAEAAAAQQQIQNQIDQAQRLKSEEALREFLNEKGTTRRIVEPGAAADLETKFLEFRMAVPKFRAATEDYRWNMSMNGKLDKSLKNLEAQSDVLLRYLNATKMNHPRPDAQEFKGFSQTELAWETLSTAERIASFLDLAVVVERKNVVAAQTLEFLYTLNGELLRLKWLTTHTK
jgi:hypothetical protein